MIILSAFCAVEFFTFLNVLILCMIQYKVFHAKIFSKLAGILDCGVMFLIRIEDITLSVQAECFVEHPVTAFGVFLLALVVWLIATAGKYLSTIVDHLESELFCLGGTDVKEGHFLIEDRSLLTVFYFDQVKSVTNVLCLLFIQKLKGHVFQKSDHLIMGIDIRLALVSTFFHILADDADHPDDSHDMVYVLMCNKDLMDIHQVNTCLLQLGKYSISTASVNQKMAVLIAEHETCIVAFCYQCVTCSKHG